MMLKSEKRYIKAPAGRMKLLILRPEHQKEPLPGILWIHGGGYRLGMSEMVYFSCGKMLAKKYGAMVLSPEYRLSGKAPYPAAVKDCYAALHYMHAHAEELGIRKDCLIVGGESAGGGLAAAVCMLARDIGKIKIAFQIPLYPMLDCEDTPSSRNNHAFVWNTRRNRPAWKRYLGKLYGTKHVPKYASPARETDYSGLPPAYTYVCDGEPFLDETRTYIQNLNDAGIQAKADVFHANMHAFDMFLFWKPCGREAKKNLCLAYEEAVVKPYCRKTMSSDQ